MASDLAQRAREALLVDLLDSSGCRPTLLLETEDVAVKIVGWGYDGLRVVAPGQHRVRGNVRVRFDHQGANHGVIQMLSTVNSYVIAYPKSGVETELCLRYRAVHTDVSEDTLVDFLQDDLRLTELDEDDVEKRPEGWFYKFPETPGKELYNNQPAFITENDPALRRKEERVSVRVPLTYYLGDDRCEGTAYNVSMSGVYITSPETIPPMDTPVRIFFPLANAGTSEQAIIQGKVCWTAPAMGPTGGGFCVRIENLQDGDDGDIWRAYVKGETTFGGTLQVDFKGDEPATGKRN